MKILLVTDVPGWAWDHKANGLIKYATPDFQIEKTCSHKMTQESIARYDVVHFFNWRDGIRFRRHHSCGVSSYNFVALHKADARKYLPGYKAIGATSQELADYLKQAGYSGAALSTPNGVDHNLFFPRKAQPSQKVVVGWVGQPTSGALDLKGHRVDYHGFEHVYKELQRILVDSIEFRPLVKTYKDALSHAQMVEYYNGLDWFVSTCWKAGTPNPAFEAMACGIPVITTRCGAIQDAITDGVSGRFVSSYSCLDTGRRTAHEVRKIILNTTLGEAAKMGAAGRAVIEKDWTWQKLFSNYARLFHTIKER